MVEQATAINYPEFTDYRKKNGLDPLGMQNGFVTLLGSVELIAVECRFRQQPQQRHATRQRPRCGNDAWLRT